MWIDDYHDHFVRPETMEELEEHIAALVLYKKGKEGWERMYANILKCVEMFGFKNISLYSHDYMKYGSGIDEFLCGFWVNLKDAEYSDGYIAFEDNSIEIENGFMFIRH